MGILDRAASRLGYIRQDSAPPTPASSPAPAPQRPSRQWRGDDWSGILGAYAGRLQYSAPGGTLFAAEELYSSDGIAARIVDRPAEDAVARGFEIEGDEAGEFIQNELDRLDASAAFTDCLRWTRLYGGAAILPLMDDGLPLDAPIDVSRIRQITDLMVYPSASVNMGNTRYNDPSLPNYGWPTHYDVRPRWGMSFPVHESRLLTVSGDPLPYSAAANARLPWLGRGVLEGCYADLCRYRESLRLAKEILLRKQQAVHSLSGLGDMLQAGLDDIVAKRLETADMARNILTAVSIDADDKFQVLDSSLGGIDGIIHENKIAVCASSGVPMLIIFQQQPSGQNATGAGETESWHQVLKRGQTQLQPAVEHLVSLIYAQRSLRRTEPTTWRIKWRQLWSLTEKEVAEIDKIKAEARKIGVEAINALGDGGLTSPEENRDLARETAFPELPKGPPPEPEPEPELIEAPSGVDPEAELAAAEVPGAA